MQFLGIGPLELLLITVIAVVVLGPKGMVSGARQVGKAIRKIVHSPIWHEIVDTSREIREFPKKLAREVGIEKDLEELRRSTQGTFNDFDRTHQSNIFPVSEQEGKRSNTESSVQRIKSEEENHK